MAKVECLKAAVAYRTPGTSAEATILIASVLWDWVRTEDPAPETSDTPRPAAPMTAPKAARAAGGLRQGVDRAMRGNPSETSPLS